MIKPWLTGTSLKVLSEIYQMNTNITGFRCFNNDCILMLLVKVVLAWKGLTVWWIYKYLSRFFVINYKHPGPGEMAVNHVIWCRYYTVHFPDQLKITAHLLRDSQGAHSSIINAMVGKVYLYWIQPSTLTQNLTGPVGPVAPSIYWSCKGFTGPTNFSLT